MNQIEGGKIGVIAVIYDHNYTEVLEDLTNIQHDYREYINATMHVHMTEKYHLDVIVVKGNIKYIRDLTEQIKKKA